MSNCGKNKKMAQHEPLGQCVTDVLTTFDSIIEFRDKKKIWALPSHHMFSKADTCV